MHTQHNKTQDSEDQTNYRMNERKKERKKERNDDEFIKSNKKRKNQEFKPNQTKPNEKKKFFKRFSKMQFQTPNFYSLFVSFHE